MRRTTRTLAFGLLVTVVVSAGVEPAAAAGNGRPVERPYKEKSFVSGEGDADCDSTDFPLVVCTFTYSGDLIANHIGRAHDRGVAVSTIDFSGSCDGPGGLVGLPMTQTLDAVITAADGSELFYEGVGRECVVAGDQRDYTAEWWVTGGTGRFEGASGEMTATESTSVGILRY